MSAQTGNESITQVPDPSTIDPGTNQPSTIGDHPDSVKINPTTLPMESDESFYQVTNPAKWADPPETEPEWEALQATYDSLTDGLKNMSLSNLIFKASVTATGYFVDLSVAVNRVVHKLTVRVPILDEAGNLSAFTRLLRAEMGDEEGVTTDRIVIATYLEVILGEGSHILSVDLEGNCNR